MFFWRKLFRRVVKTTFYVSRGSITGQHFWKMSWNLEDFWIVFEIFGTTAENIFQGWQNSNRCPGEQFMENIFSDEKNSLFFPILSDFVTSGEKLCQFCEPRNLRMPWSNWGNSFFSNIYNLSLFFGLWSKKRLVGKFFHDLSQLQSTRPEAFFWIKVIFPRKIIFVHLFWSLSSFLLSFDKKSQGVRETTY